MKFKFSIGLFADFGKTSKNRYKKISFSQLIKLCFKIIDHHEHEMFVTAYG